MNSTYDFVLIRRISAHLALYFQSYHMKISDSRTRMERLAVRPSYIHQLSMPESIEGAGVTIVFVFVIVIQGMEIPKSPAFKIS